MTPSERVEELRRIAIAEIADRAVDVAMRAGIALAESVPLRGDALAQRIAARDDAQMRVVIELPRSVRIEMLAGDEKVEMFRRDLDIPATFSAEDAR